MHICSYEDWVTVIARRPDGPAMSEVVLTKHRVAPGKTERLREWMAEIESRREEALRTLRHEGMHTEAAFLERGEEADYLVYFMEAEDVEHVFEAFANSPYEIDAEHQRVLDEVLVDGSGASTEPLYHLVNPDRP